eukprot:jgi/Picre1/30141/NNA_005510.t1
MLKPYMNEGDVINMIALSSEFENLNVRDDELPELDELSRGCKFPIKGGSESKHGKTSILLQTYVSREKIESFSLIADLNYVSQNAPRLARALFEICMNKGWPSAAAVCLSVSKSLEWRLWPFQHPLWQFESFLKPNIIEKVEALGFDMLQLKEMKADELGAALRHPSAGPKILSALSNIPAIDLDATLVPITRTVVRIQLSITPAFRWRDSIHGNSLRWFIWVEDSETERIYHSEIFNLTKFMCREGKQVVMFPVPVREPLPSQYYVKAVSESWIGFELSIVEMTGDITPDLRALLASDIIVTTPEKWDGISRNWQSRAYVKTVGLVIMDEIHLLGADRGPILEVIVSRMRYISAITGSTIRFVGLSTALANASDLAGWLGVKKQGLFNFKPSVRPVPLECHIQGYPGKFYCPRMATMNKPAYAAIGTHSPYKPVLIFVASRRQTRLTALDLITYAAADGKPRAFLRMEEEEMDAILETVEDSSLRHTLQFGVGLHHAGLSSKDRSIVERLYVDGKIQVLVATSTLAWGVNTPAHLVIVKGTEYFDAASRRYVDYPITDVLQMMGRAGRPQYDKQGVAVIMVHDPKKSFYKKFLYEPFPVESSLHLQLEDHLNAEIATGTIESKQECIDYLTWTFFLRRLMQNPSYYGLEATDSDSVSLFLCSLIDKSLEKLQDCECIEIDDETGAVSALPPWSDSSFYYLSHKTMKIFSTTLHGSMDQWRYN